jgi:hypothetical protein
VELPAGFLDGATLVAMRSRDVQWFRQDLKRDHFEATP